MKAVCEICGAHPVRTYRGAGYLAVCGGCVREQDADPHVTWQGYDVPVDVIDLPLRTRESRDP